MLSVIEMTGAAHGNQGKGSHAVVEIHSSRERVQTHGCHQESDRELLGVPKSEWAAAKRKERIVKRALRNDVESAAAFAGCSERTIRRLVASYRIEPSPLAFLPRRPGPKPGSQRLELAQESIIATAVERWKASAEPLPMERAVEDVRRLAKAAGIKPAARNTISLRLWGHGGK